MTTIDQDQADRFYRALLERDPKYVGTFFVGVTSTSVFCIATCRARKPKRKNVVFFSDFKAALHAGFRPCKICRPTENANEAPEHVAQAIQLVKENPKEKISDARLRAMGIGPEAVRRWFKSNYGVTFQAYQRMYRINQAMLELKQGKAATATAYDAGYESLSGFGYTYKKLLGKSPQKSASDSTILIQRLTTPLGPMLACATGKGICLLEFVDRKMLETEFHDLQKRLQGRIIAGENSHLKQLKRELESYFAGDLKQFGVALHKPGTDFQQEVWKALQKIPFGSTTHYQALAKSLNRPQSARAVAAANGANRISILVPCHRVLGKDGSLTGYGGGLARKQWLLDHEARHMGA